MRFIEAWRFIRVFLFNNEQAWDWKRYQSNVVRLRTGNFFALLHCFTASVHVDIRQERENSFNGIGYKSRSTR